MSDPESQTQSLMRSASQQTGMDGRPPGQGARSTRAYKVAGLTVVACVLILGQAAITYLVLNQRSEIKSLQEQNDKMRMDLTRPRSVSVPMRMQVPMPSMLDFTSDALEERFSTGSPEKALAPLTQCQRERAGQLPTQIPGVLPFCDRLGLYQDQQCFSNHCWCVTPDTGEIITGSLRRGSSAFCRATGRRRMGKFASSMLMPEETVLPNED